MGNTACGVPRAANCGGRSEMRTSLERHETNGVSAILMQPVLPVYDRPVLMNEAPETTDILLHGQRVQITEVCPDESFDDSVAYNATRHGRLFHFVTDYGYDGYLPDAGGRLEPLSYLDTFYRREDIGVADAERMRGLWQQYAEIASAYEDAYEEVEAKGYGNIYNPHAGLATVWASCADLLPVTNITDTVSGRITLFRGAKLLVAADQDNVKSGWTRVYPASTPFYGEEEHFSDEAGAETLEVGAYYIRSSALVPRFPLTEVQYDAATKMEGCAVYGHVMPENEPQFRRNVVEAAMLYRGTQYRWAGKTINGIDCSGLCSMAYMLNGVYIYRDAEIVAGYPVRQILDAAQWQADPKAALARLRPADLLYYKGHITMYLGDGKYIHSTGKAGSDGVVINSFDPSDPLYREDLARDVLAAGSIFW